jgi:hypothetical protein
MPTYSSSSCAFSRTSASSLRTDGGLRIEPNSPAFIRACSPTMTFSVAVIVPNSRMFWNVRATPPAVIWSGRQRVTFFSSKSSRPEVGL